MAPEVSDNCDQGVADAEAAVSAAEQAVQDAQDALTAANNDAFITPEEVADLQAKYQAAEDALGAAQAAVDALPASDAKNDFQDRINALDNITVPEVSDNFDQGIADAEAAMSAAELAVQDAQDALDAANDDDFITPEEVADLQAKYQAAEDEIGTAQDRVNALPASDAKNDFQDRIDALDNITVPEVSDNFDQAVTDAEAAVSAAELAVQDAQNALDAANDDGFITPEEVADLQAKYQAAEDALGAAQDAVNALPASDAKDGFQGRIDALENITVPSVSENYDDAVADAEAAVSAAELAVQDAQNALNAANDDDFITPEEVAELQAKHDAAENALGAAQDAVDALPASDAKNDFQGRIDALDNITVPEVSDNFDQGIADAEAAVSAAEQAVQDAQNALNAANDDDFITPEEVADLQAKYQAAEDALGAAQDAVNALPASDAKNDFQGRIDALENITVPEVSQTYEDAVNNATDLLADAKAAVDAAEQALEDAIADGKVEQSEVDALIAAKDAAQTDLDAAEAAIDALPEGSAKDDLVAELGTEQDRLDAIEVPA